MVSLEDSVQLQLSDPQGYVHGSLQILARSPKSLFILPEIAAAERGEEPVQLVEGRSYEYSLNLNTPSALRLRETRTVQPSHLTDSIGRIEPGLATGLLPIVLENHAHEEVARLHVEVRTAKLDYHVDYRKMLDYIADVSINLLMDIQAPSHARMISDDSLPSNTLHERFAFLRHLLGSQSFHESMQRILSMPHHRTEPTTLSTDIRQGIRSGRSVSLALARNSRRMPLPTSHPTHNEMKRAGIQSPSLPVWIDARRPIDTRDTPANQFVKHALNDFLNVLMDIEDRLVASQTSSNLRLLREVGPLKRSIAEYLDSDLFKEVGNATVLPLANPVLQRRNGYREILEAWFKFSLAAQLSWTGGEDVFGGGKKDVALLYEYWLFFVLLDIVSQELRISAPIAPALFELTSNGFDMRLKAGSTFSFTGTYNGGTRSVQTRFSYNRTFPGNPDSSGFSHPRPGSWTRSMRPDFTFSVWPDALTELEAEQQESIVHIHFDAKYRVESITGLFGTDSTTELENEDIASRTNGRPKRSDLLKMHAYRDAIRRTEGAYVLYPGPPSGDYAWTEYHEIIPGLGAFAVRPEIEGAAKESLAQFIRDILHHMSHLNTRREQLSNARYRTQRFAD